MNKNLSSDIYKLSSLEVVSFPRQRRLDFPRNYDDDPKVVYVRLRPLKLSLTYAACGKEKQTGKKYQTASQLIFRAYIVLDV